jgi:hypothetical protein
VRTALRRSWLKILRFSVSNFLQDRSLLKIATNLLEQPPAFWGRYFKGPGNKMPIQYQASQEAVLFANHNIRVLPIARQTRNVSQADKDLRYADGVRNAAALISSFGAVRLSKMPGVVIFLDVEPETPLNRAYYEGWSAGLVEASINTQRPFADALRMELAAAGDNQRALRAIARNLIAIASSGEPIALQAIREIADRTDGRARQTTDVTLHNANARELSDDDLAAIAVGADVERQEIQENPQTDLPKLNLAAT